MPRGKPRAELAGQKFGRLTVIRFLEVKDGHCWWDCLCDCGNSKQTRTNMLISKNTASCGCLRGELSGKISASKRKQSTCHSDRKHYAKGLCKSCWKKSNYNPEKQKLRCEKLKKELGPEGYHLLLKKQALKACYGISLDTLDKMKKDQEGICPCGRAFSKFVPCVDHNHSCCPSQKTCGLCLRGLLCNRCNTVLGLLEEDVNLLPEYLVKYLNKYEKNSLAGL